MIKIHFLGTCSGTEPMPDTHHTSLLLEIGDAIYWFDAGEGCAHRAYTSGIDVLKARALFISHPHLDHTGGLANLLACFRKLNARYKTPLHFDNTLMLFCPSHDVVEAAKTIATGSKGEELNFRVIENGITDGVIYEDESVCVSALHNAHLGEDGENGFHSFSFLIEAEGKRIVYSGDVLTPDELDPIVNSQCDLLIMETGHHKVSAICEYARTRGACSLIFNHHGREILNDRETACRLVFDASEKSLIPMLIAYDGMEHILE